MASDELSEAYRNQDRNSWIVYSEGVASHFQTTEITLGPTTSFELVNDPKHLGFTFARYKFVAKMLEGKQNVLEVGCGDAPGTPAVEQFVAQLHCIDWDSRYIEGNIRRLGHLENVTFACLDITSEIPGQQFDAVYSLDMIEHLDPKDEPEVMANICRCLKPNGVLITGTPNLNAAQYASEAKNRDHINLHTHQSLKTLMEKHFINTFMFGMNDEVLHTGFPAMAHYIFAISAGVRQPSEG